MSLSQNSIAVDAYISTYGVSKIVPYSSTYPDFKQSAKLSVPDQTYKVNIVLGSASELKIKVTTQFFNDNPDFKDKKLRVIGLKAASDIAEQPINLDNAILGAKNRIKNAKTIPFIDDRMATVTYYLAIENFFSELKPGVKPTDHAVVIIEAPGGTQYTYLSDGVEVDPKVYRQVVTQTNLAKDGTGANSSIGEYLAATYKINSADWFAYVTGKPYTRDQQIMTAFKFASKISD